MPLRQTTTRLVLRYAAEKMSKKDKALIVGRPVLLAASGNIGPPKAAGIDRLPHNLHAADSLTRHSSQHFANRFAGLRMPQVGSQFC